MALAVQIFGFGGDIAGFFFGVLDAFDLNLLAGIASQIEQEGSRLRSDQGEDGNKKRGAKKHGRFFLSAALPQSGFTPKVLEVSLLSLVGCRDLQ